MNIQQRSGEVALICGGTAGIGLASARALLGAGVDRVMLVGRNPGRATAACADLRGGNPEADIRYVTADLSQPAQASAAIETCIAAFGRIDTLLSGAGGDPLPRLLHEIPIESVQQTIGSITSSILLPVRAALPHMMRQKSGTILCIASDAGKVATPGEVCIGAAMAAVAMFCRALAIEAKRNGIRVNCLTPSIVRDTPLYHTLMADPFAGKLFSKAEGLARLGVVSAEDLADLVVFLSSPSAARLTGQTISVNGGISAA